MDAAGEADELLAAAATGSGTDLEAMVARRETGEPLAWIVGSIEFCGIKIAVDPGVYVPRLQTEDLARRAAALTPEGGVAVDLCTGCGAVARTIVESGSPATVVATDTDAAAVACARRNGVDARRGDLDEPLPSDLVGQVDVMTAVVPYVPTDKLRLLPRDVLAFEPRRALDGGDDGLRFLTTVVSRSTRWLRPGGWLLLELGGDQAEALTQHMSGAGFTDIAVGRDGEGDDRFIEGRRRT